MALNSCTVLWGTQHAVIKSLVPGLQLPFLVNAIRFSIAAAVTWVVRVVVRAVEVLLVRRGGPLVANGVSFGAQQSSGRCGPLLAAAEA